MCPKMAHQQSLLHFFAKRRKTSDEESIPKNSETKEITAPTATGTAKYIQSNLVTAYSNDYNLF